MKFLPNNLCLYLGKLLFNFLEKVHIFFQTTTQLAMYFPNFQLRQYLSQTIKKLPISPKASRKDPKVFFFFFFVYSFF